MMHRHSLCALRFVSASGSGFKTDLVFHSSPLRNATEHHITQDKEPGRGKDPKTRSISHKLKVTGDLLSLDFPALAALLLTSGML